MKTQFGLSDRAVLEVVTYQLPLHYFTTIAASHKCTVFVSLHTLCGISKTITFAIPNR